MKEKNNWNGKKLLAYKHIRFWRKCSSLNGYLSVRFRSWRQSVSFSIMWIRYAFVFFAGEFRLRRENVTLCTQSMMIDRQKTEILSFFCLFLLSDPFKFVIFSFLVFCFLLKGHFSQNFIPLNWKITKHQVGSQSKKRKNSEFSLQWRMRRGKNLKEVRWKCIDWMPSFQVYRRFNHFQELSNKSD